ncbi:MAG TPA: response regulator transcription factor [Gaiellaceae bacterium]|nr:response regulator transcription factor [Gaiellaceae bacterium]
MAKVLVVDDDSAFRSLVMTVLENAGYATAEAPTGDQALAVGKNARPLVVVLDVNLPGLSGYEVCYELRAIFGHTLPIIFCSGERTESFDRVAGLLVGADDYLTKPFAPDELVARVRRLVRPSEPAAIEFKLTDRELQILRLLTDGLSQPEIAKELTISPKTVGTHIQNILGKLGVRNRTQAVALAFRSDMVRVA